MASEKIENSRTHTLIEAAIPLLDHARAVTNGLKAAHESDEKSLAASALSLAIQGLVMAHFIQFKSWEVQGETAVEATISDFHAAFAGLGQSVGMCLFTLSQGDRVMSADLADTVMRSMAGAMVARERR